MGISPVVDGLRYHLQNHLAQKRALFRENEFVLLGGVEVRHALRILTQPGAIGFIRSQTLEGDQRKRDIVGALVRHEIADQIAAAVRDDGEPALRILLELRALERIELVADEDGDGHDGLLWFQTVIASAAKRSRNPSAEAAWIVSSPVQNCFAILSRTPRNDEQPHATRLPDRNASAIIEA